MLAGHPLWSLPWPAEQWKGARGSSENTAHLYTCCGIKVFKSGRVTFGLFFVWWEILSIGYRIERKKRQKYTHASVVEARPRTPSTLRQSLVFYKTFSLFVGPRNFLSQFFFFFLLTVKKCVIIALQKMTSDTVRWETACFIS